VDYEAISMLNVSATQELARKVDAQQAELKKLEAKLGQQLAEKETLLKHLAALEARDQAREDRLARLESTLEKGSAQASYAALNR
jgi:septal ring factor EnvC (AmiA/AmiB activator)